MTTSSDLVFSGQRRVIVVNAHDAFVSHTGDLGHVRTYLAGSYADADLPGTVVMENTARLFGQFALLRHDVHARTLTIAIDRFGHFPLYMACERDVMYLSSDFHALASRCEGHGNPDYGAMSDILAVNVPLDRKTTSSRISTLPGSVAITVDLDTLTTRRQTLWDPAQLLARADLAFDKVKDELVDLFLEGVELATAGMDSVSVTLSGGADSRCLLAACLHLGKDVRTYSTGVPGSRALTYAKGMAAACGVPHVEQALGNEFVTLMPSFMAQANQLMHGMSFSSEVEAMWLRQHVVPGGVMLHGAFGELYKIREMHQYPYDGILSRSKGGALAEQLWKRFEPGYNLRKACYAEPYQQLLGDQARSHLADKVAHHQRQLDTAGVLQMMYIEEFLGKVVKASGQMWRHRIAVMFPFAYPPLVDLILRVRPEDKLENRFVTHVLKRTSKILGSYPDANTGVRIGASRVRRELMHVFDYASKRLVKHQRRFDHQDFASWLSRTPAGLGHMFDSFQEETGVFNMPQVDDLVRRCHAGDGMAGRTVSFLWAWHLWTSDAANKDNWQSPQRQPRTTVDEPAFA